MKIQSSVYQKVDHEKMIKNKYKTQLRQIKGLPSHNINSNL